MFEAKVTPPLWLTGGGVLAAGDQFCLSCCPDNRRVPSVSREKQGATMMGWFQLRMSLDDGRWGEEQ